MNQKEPLKAIHPETEPPDAEKPVRVDWQHLLLSLCVMVVMCVVVRFFNIPNPNMLLITGLCVCTSLYGYGAGVVCGGVMMLYSMYFFSIDHHFMAYTPENLKRLATILAGVVLNVLFIGRLKQIHYDAEQKLRDLNRVLQLDNYLLEQASIIDSLTGTRNRHAFRRDYNKYQSCNIHVMMFDLDNFKTANDTYGHAVGDFVLQNTGRLLRKAFGDACCYRYGGDEFLIIRPDTPDPEFTAKLEALHRDIHAFSMNGQPIPASFSAGYVYGHAEQSDDLRLMLRQADHNLYEAKELGKDCFVGSEYVRAFAEALDSEREDEPATSH